MAAYLLLKCAGNYYTPKTLTQFQWPKTESADDWANEAIVSKLSAVTVRKGDPDFTDRFNERWNKQKLSLLERCVLLRMWDC